jgi:hypothetical protein
MTCCTNYLRTCRNCAPTTPHDFWPQFQLRCDELLENAPPQQRPLVQRRIDEILIAHQLGPADPGA